MFVLHARYTIPGKRVYTFPRACKYLSGRRVLPELVQEGARVQALEQPQLHLVHSRPPLLLQRRAQPLSVDVPADCERAYPGVLADRLPRPHLFAAANGGVFVQVVDDGEFGDSQKKEIGWAEAAGMEVWHTVDGLNFAKGRWLGW